jgi:hypothetical protein
MRWRTVVGSIAILLWMFIYCLLAWWLGSKLPNNMAIMSIYALVTGIAWIFPALKIYKWTRKDAGSELRNP